MATPRYSLGQIVTVNCKNKWSVGSIIEIPENPGDLYRIYLVDEDRVILDSWRNIRVSNSNAPVPPAALGRNPLQKSPRNDLTAFPGPTLEGRPDNNQPVHSDSIDLGLESLLDGSLDNFVLPMVASQPTVTADSKKTKSDFNMFGDNLDNSLEDFVIPNPPSQSAKKTERFKDLDDDDLDDLQKCSKAEATHKTTRWAVKVFRDWLISKDMSPDFEHLPSEPLSMLLRRFYGEVMNSKGDSYSKQSLVGIRAGIHRHLRSAPYSRLINIFTDSDFYAANEVLQGRIRVMRILGEDSSTSHPPISSADISKMYSTKTLSTRDPSSLQYKTYFELALHFGRRGREGLRELKSDSIIFKRDSENREYATLNHQPHEKNHIGMSNRQNEHDQRMYGTGTSECPVSSLKLYLSKLNSKCSSFFQRPKVVKWEGSDTWYNNSPVGRNTIGKYMSVISKKADLSVIYTNHSIRSTTITTLRNKYFQDTDIVNVTGHRNIGSLQHYSKSSDTTRKDMSSVLSSAIGKNLISFEENNETIPFDPSHSSPSEKKRTATLKCSNDLPSKKKKENPQLPSKSKDEISSKIPKESPPPNVMDITQFIVDLSDFDEDKAPEISEFVNPPSQITTNVVNSISNTQKETDTQSIIIKNESNGQDIAIPKSFFQQATFNNCTFNFNLGKK